MISRLESRIHTEANLTHPSQVSCDEVREDDVRGLADEVRLE